MLPLVNKITLLEYLLKPYKPKTVKKLRLSNFLVMLHFISDDYTSRGLCNDGNDILVAMNIYFPFFSAGSRLIILLFIFIESQI